MKKLNWFRVIAVIVVVVAIVWVGKYGLEKYRAKTVNSDSYYAVFLSNDQVYFGHLADVEDSYVSLTNIYYLQVAKPLQSTSASTLENTADTTDTQSKLTLIKLGKELHGPKDAMKINRDSILFYEELSNDSKVVQTINKSK